MVLEIGKIVLSIKFYLNNSKYEERDQILKVFLPLKLWISLNLNLNLSLSTSVLINHNYKLREFILQFHLK